MLNIIGRQIYNRIVYSVFGVYNMGFVRIISMFDWRQIIVNPSTKTIEKEL